MAITPSSVHADRSKACLRQILSRSFLAELRRSVRPVPVVTLCTESRNELSKIYAGRVRVATNSTKSVELAGANNIATNIGILRVAAIWRANANLLCLASSKGDIGAAP